MQGLKGKKTGICACITYVVFFFFPEVIEIPCIRAYLSPISSSDRFLQAVATGMRKPYTGAARKINIGVPETHRKTRNIMGFVKHSEAV